MSNPKLLNTLEALVDSEGLAFVLSALGEVCELKAEHLRAWQSEHLARTWDRRAVALQDATARVTRS